MMKSYLLCLLALTTSAFANDSAQAVRDSVAQAQQSIELRIHTLGSESPSAKVSAPDYAALSQLLATRFVDAVESYRKGVVETIIPGVAVAHAEVDAVLSDSSLTAEQRSKLLQIYFDRWNSETRLGLEAQYSTLIQGLYLSLQSDYSEAFTASAVLMNESDQLSLVQEIQRLFDRDLVFSPTMDGTRWVIPKSTLDVKATSDLILSRAKEAAANLPLTLSDEEYWLARQTRIRSAALDLLGDRLDQLAGDRSSAARAEHCAMVIQAIDQLKNQGDEVTYSELAWRVSDRTRRSRAIRNCLKRNGSEIR